MEREPPCKLERPKKFASIAEIMEKSEETKKKIRPKTMEKGKEEAKPRLPKVYISLTKEEIIEDFIAMTGSKPPRKPRFKRDKKIQGELDQVFPGVWLASPTPSLGTSCKPLPKGF